MIIKKNTVIPVFILLILFTSLFVSIVSIAQMPDKIMGEKDIYVLTSSTDKNPLRSNLDINIAYGLENMSYVESVSPEIFVFTTIANKAVTIRGVIFSKLLSLEGGKIIEGEMPHDYGDALLGYRAQKILNLKIGEKLAIRGGFASSLAVINITGIYKSDSPTDDEIIVDLSTARKLAGIGNDEISIIRIKSKNQVMLKKFMDPKSPKFTVNLNVTSESYIGESINVSAKIKNMGINVGNCDLTLFWNGREIKYSNISVYTEKTVSLEIKAPKIPGNYTLKATVSNSLLHYTSSVNIKVKKRPIFVRGPTNIIENAYSIFYAYSIHQENLENLTLEIRGEGYSSLSTGNSPLRIKISRSGNYTLVFSKEGYQAACIEVKVYKKVPLEELATIKNLYNGTIILPKGEKIEIETDGKIYFSIDNSSLVEKSGNITIPQYLKGMHKVNITVIKDTMLGWQNFDLLILENYNPEVISLHPSEKAYYGETVSFQIRDKLPIKNVSVYYENKRKDYEINQKLGMKENYTFNVTVTLNSSEEIRIFFSDILDKVYNASFKFHLIYQKDVIPPEIIVPDKIEIWGGNSTIIRAEDNVALDFLSVFIFGRYFNTTSTAISIPT
ncbi:MAG: hypothetical protein J7L63_00615, partial [Thermoplasmata archaeon]|nr:hypothetical protein [Thermoplasmata archaeon]